MEKKSKEPAVMAEKAVCKGVIITCMDRYLHQRADGSNLVADFIKSLGYDCDLITRAGGILDLVHPAETGQGFNRSVLRDIKISVKFHGAENVILLGHENCGGYDYLHLSQNAKQARTINDLKSAGNLLVSQFRQVKVMLYIAELKPGGNNQFVIKEIR
jgi:hypothetical protein